VGPDGHLSQWLVLGPLPLPKARTGPARLALPWALPAGDPSTVKPGEPVTYLDVHGRRRVATWRVNVAARATVDLREDLPLRSWETFVGVLLGVEIEADADRTILLHLGHDDGVAVWLNGRAVVTDLRPTSYVADRLRLALPLVRGPNRLVIQLAHSRGRLRVRARLTGPDHERLGSGVTAAGVRLRLPRAPAVAALPGLAARTLRLEPRRAVGPQAVAHVIRVSAPGGVILPPDGKAYLGLADARKPARVRERVALDLAALSRAARDVATDDYLSPRSGDGAIDGLAQLPGRRALRFRVAPQTSHAGLVAGLIKDLAALRATPGRDPGVLDALAYHVEALRTLLAAADPDGRYVGAEITEVRAALRQARSGADPWAWRHGRVIRALRSPLDGSLQPYALWVPKEHGPGQPKLPLYVMLHGMGGDPRVALSQALGLYPADEKATPWERYVRTAPAPAAATAPRVLILAPAAFGDSFYSQEGEEAVRAAIADVIRRYRVDERRIVLMGHSMGGTGALDLAVREPHRFAGVVPLASTPSRFQLREVRRGPLLPHERFVAEAGSPAAWSPMGRHLPLIAVHGKADGPDRSEALVKAWRRHGGKAEVRLFDGGHDVWRPFFATGQIYTDAAAWQAAAMPAHVTLRTPRLRWGRAYWVTAEGRDQSGAWSSVDAVVRPGNRVVVKTENVTDLAFAPGPPLVARGKPFTAVLDGQALVSPDGRFHRVGATWQAGPRPAPPAGERWKRPGLEGPLEDVHHHPVIVVYGTRDAAQSRSLARAAAALAGNGSSDIHYPVKRDVDLTDADLARASVILVGGPAENAVTARWAKHLPVKLGKDALALGPCRFTGTDLGVKLVHPHPTAAGKYVVLVAGTSAAAVLRHALLPRYLPDVVVWDASIERVDGHRIMGPYRRYLAAGYFDRQWKATADLCPAVPRP
jgi:predicted esterase